MRIRPEPQLNDVSLLIASFGRPELLREAIKSSLKAAAAGAELIVSDDLSTRSLEIRKMLRPLDTSGQIRVLMPVRNIGMAANWNLLLAAANRKYCYFLGDDDLLDTAAMCDAARLVREYDTPIAVTGFRTIAPDRGLLGLASSRRPVGPAEFRRIFYDVLIDAPSVALRFFHSFSMFICKERALGLPFDASVGNGADRLFLLRNLLAGVPICCCPHPVLQWRRPVIGTSFKTLSSDQDANLRSNFLVAQKLIASLDQRRYPDLPVRLYSAAGLQGHGRSEIGHFSETTARRRLASTGRRLFRLSVFVRTKLRLAITVRYRRARAEAAPETL